MRNVTKRGWFVLGLLAAGAIWPLVWVSGSLWWTDSGFCLGSAAECLLGGL